MQLTNYYLLHFCFLSKTRLISKKLTVVQQIHIELNKVSPVEPNRKCHSVEMMVDPPANRSIVGNVGLSCNPEEALVLWQETSSQALQNLL